MNVNAGMEEEPPLPITEEEPPLPITKRERVQIFSSTTIPKKK